MLNEEFLGAGAFPDLLPRPRGELSGRLLAALRGPAESLAWPDSDAVAAATSEDFDLALYCCYELHYGGLDGVDEEWEWEPGLLGFRALLERRLEAELRALVGPVEVGPDEVVTELHRLAGSGGGRSLSGWLSEQGTFDQLREVFVHRSAYQLKEADPHTWAVPRLSGSAKATLFEIQYGEYGEGDGDAMHSSLFAEAMECIGLDTRPNAYLDRIPGLTLRSTNLISFFGLHRRLRGALVGHLALFEMTSVGPMSRYAEAVDRLGLPARARRFYEVHIEADVAHAELAAGGLVGGLVKAEPLVAGDVVFGARALQEVEAGVTEMILSAFESGASSLLPGPAIPG